MPWVWLHSRGNSNCLVVGSLGAHHGPSMEEARAWLLQRVLGALAVARLVGFLSLGSGLRRELDDSAGSLVVIGLQHYHVMP